MLKKQAFAVLVTLMSLIGSAFGLGLGEIEVKSNLNDPLEAEIKLIQLQGLTAGEILPTLASNDDFRRAGVERSFFLSNIQFRVRENEAGDLVVHLTTRQVVREPFLNFLVEVNWPGGRLLKEYTVLLDPPVFDTGLAVDALVVDSDSSTGTTILGTDLVTTTVVDTPEATSETTVAAQPVTPRDDTLPAGQYRVQRNDTLWEIALKVPGREGYSPQQVMLAIQDLNPEAFLNNNINRVKAGSVLTLPDGRQMSVRSFQEAIDEVQAQNRGAAPNLRSPVAESSDVQLSATDSTSSALPSSDSERNPDGYLELTSDAESTTTSASGDAAATIDRLQNQLSVAEELNDQFERERDELESRIDELNEQIAIMERLLDVQNSDLAEVQQALSQDGDAADSTDAVTDQTSQTDTTTADTTSTDAQTDTTSTTDTATQTTPAVQPTVTTPTTPVQPPVQTGPAGFMGFVNEMMRMASDWVMASITNMAITGAALLLLILLPLYVRSKRAGSNKTLSEMTAVEDESYEEVGDLEGDFDEDLLAEVEDDFEEEEIDEPETLDAVVEAEMYMAYQKYDQAEEKLKEAFAEHPDRADVGLKLLEVYAETGDANAFNELENRLSLNSEEKGQVAELRAKLPIGGVADVDAMSGSDLDDDLNLGLDTGLDSGDDLDLGGDLDFDMDLDDGTSSPAVSNDDLDFNLEDDTNDGMLDLDLGEDEPSLEVPAMSEPEAEELSTDLDFSLDLGDLDEPAESNDSAEDLDFSLDGLEDESLDLDLAGDSEPAEESSDLDFSLELEQDGPVDEVSLDADLDLSSEEPSLDMDLESELGSLDTSSDLDLDLGSDPVSEAESDLDLSLDDAGLDLGSSDFDSGSLDLETETDSFDSGLSLDSDLSLDADSDLSLDEGLDAFESEADLEAPSEETEIDMDVSADPLEQLASSLDSDAELEEDEFDFLSGNDEASTKLDLARAYIEMDDKEGARDILEEVAAEGNDDQKAQAQELMAQL